MTLTDIQIQNIPNLITPFDEANLGPHSYDVTLCDELLIATYEPHFQERSWTKESCEHGFLLQPYQFALGATCEVLDVPNYLVGFVQGKSTIGRNGLQIECAGLIDAGFHGTITLEFFNMAPWPVKLKAGMRIGQVHFSTSATPPRDCYKKKGSYNGQMSPTPPKYEI